MKKLLLLSFFLPFLIFSQDYTSYFTGNSTNINTSPDGGVCMMGGATEHDEAMKWFLERADGGDILVLRASGSDGYNDYMFADLGITVNSVETIVFNNSNASNESYIHQKIEQAEAIWFAGGDQWNYIDYWRNTSIDSLINIGIAERNIVLGGTSAGMAILGNYYFSAENGTVTSTTALNNPYDIDVTVDSSSFLTIDYLNDVITDSHYDDPNRKGRHVTFLARILKDYNTIGKGIACDEYTAICIDENGLARAFGDSPNYDENVYFIQPNCELLDFTPECCQNATPLDWDLNGEALKVYHIEATMDGSKTFSLADWSSGSGGVWENWSVSNGILQETSGTSISCFLGNEEIAKNQFSIYPNPSKDVLTISSVNGISLITISDISGNTVFKTKHYGNSIKVDLNHLQTGVYFVNITGNGINQRIIKK